MARGRDCGRGEARSNASPCVFDRLGEQMTQRFDRAAMAPGGVVRGPAVIEDAFSTVVVPPGAAAAADPHGHLVITVGRAVMSGEDRAA
jgi:N-methylhydantoinase A